MVALGGHVFGMTEEMDLHSVAVHQQVIAIIIPGREPPTFVEGPADGKIARRENGTDLFQHHSSSGKWETMMNMTVPKSVVMKE